MKAQANKHILLMIVVLVCSNIFGYSVFDLYYGTAIPHHDARVAALGGTGVAGGFTLLDSNINPGNLFYLDGSGGIQLTHSSIRNSESRALPLWNFFDSYVGSSTYARNENYYLEFGLGLFYSLPIKESTLSMGFSVRPIINFGARYREEVRNDDSSDIGEGVFGLNYPPILAKNFIDSDGVLESYSFLLNWGMPVNDIVSFSLGTELSLFRGQHKNSVRIHWTEIAHNQMGQGVLPDSMYHSNNTIDGIGFRLGLTSQVTQRLRLGLVYTPKATLNSDFSLRYNDEAVDDHGDFVMPSKIRLGFLYKPRNPFRTNFHVDFEIVNYSEIDRFFDDGYAFYVGMEHYVGRAIPFRLGFSHQTAKQDRAIALPSVSIGTGFNITDHFHLNIAATYGRREYIALDLFRDGYYDDRVYTGSNNSNLWSRNFVPADRGWDNPDNVTESFLKMFTSVSFRW